MAKPDKSFGDAVHYKTDFVGAAHLTATDGTQISERVGRVAGAEEREVEPGVFEWYYYVQTWMYKLDRPQALTELVPAGSIQIN
jgi:hypothetical protein